MQQEPHGVAEPSAGLSAYFEPYLMEATLLSPEEIRSQIGLGPNDADPRFTLGLQQMVSGALDDAEQHLRAALELDSAHLASQVAMGILLCESGRFDEALACFRGAADLDPQSAELALWTGLIHEQTGHDALACIAYGKATHWAPELAEAHQRLADVYSRLGFVEQAVQVYETLMDRADVQTQWVVRLAELLRTVHRHGDALNVLVGAVEDNPTEPDLRRSLATTLGELGWLSEAISQMGIVADRCPDDASVHFALGRLLLRSGEAAAAAERFDQAILIDPEPLKYITGSAHARLRSGDMEGACQRYRQALEREPDHVEVLMGLGVCQSRLGRMPQAERTFERLAQALPDAAGARTRMVGGAVRQAVSQFARSRFSTPPHACSDSPAIPLERGIAVLQREVSRHPDYADLHYKLGVLQHCQGQLALAERSLRKAVAINPDYHEALVRLARIVAQQGHDAQARRILHAAIACKPMYPDLLRQLGALYAKGGDLAEAADAFEQALKLNPTYAEGHASLADTYERMGQPDRARQSWHAVLQTTASDTLAREARQRLGLVGS